MESVPTHYLQIPAAIFCLEDWHSHTGHQTPGFVSWPHALLLVLQPSLDWTQDSVFSLH